MCILVHTLQEGKVHMHQGTYMVSPAKGPKKVDKYLTCQGTHAWAAGFLPLHLWLGPGKVHAKAEAGCGRAHSVGSYTPDSAR